MITGGRPWPLFLVGGLFVVAIFVASFWLLLLEQAQLQQAGLQQQLLTQARNLSLVVREHWPQVGAGCIPDLVATLRNDDIHVAISGPDGGELVPLSDDAATAALPSRDDTMTALATGALGDVRRLTPNGPLHVVAIARVGDADRQLGVVTLARPVPSLIGNPAAVARMLAIVAAASGLTTLVFMLIMIRLRWRVMQRVIETARNLSAGDLRDVPDMPGEAEYSVLGSILGALRTRLATQVQLIDRQRRMLESLVDQLREGVIVARTDGRIALINPTAARLLNLNINEVDDLVGRPVEACIPQHALQNLLLTTGDEASGTDGAPAQEQARLEVQAPGGAIHLLVRASNLTLAEVEQPEQGTPPGRVVVLTDITELQRTIQMRTDFVANASHELRTPLSTIRAAIETLLSMDLATEAPAARQFLTKVDRQSGRLQQMVADLLDLSRIESPTERFEPEDLEIRKMLQDLHGRFADALERKQLDWRTEIDPPDTVTIHVNPHLLRLTLDNLVDNATKFTEPGGYVAVEIRKMPREVLVTVRDNGCGIPSDDQKRVFERFYQVQRSRSGAERGTGLGLSIVRHAVGAMRGHVRLTENPGGGTLVIVAIPGRHEDRHPPEPSDEVTSDASAL